MRCKTILSTVAWLVNECPKGEGIPGWVIQNAGNGSSGLIRLRELAKYCRLLSGTKWTGWRTITGRAIIIRQ